MLAYQAQTALQGLIVFRAELNIRKAATGQVCWLSLAGYHIDSRNLAEGSETAFKLFRGDLTWQTPDMQTNFRLNRRHVTRSLRQQNAIAGARGHTPQQFAVGRV